MSIRDRLDTLSRGEMAGLIVVVVLTLGGVGLWYTRSLPRPIQVAASPGVITASAPSGAVPTAAVSGAIGSPSASPTSLIVDVTGQVRRPGVYQFHVGDRVVDAVNRAGGPRGNADLSLLNLAAPLTDGTQIMVPKEGAAPPGTTTGTGTTTSGAPGVPGTLVNLNSATEPELETLNGVGPVTAAAIIKYREDNGPFGSVDDLDNVSGIGPVTLEELRPFVTV
jgi:competence protein ComEA